MKMSVICVAATMLAGCNSAFVSGPEAVVETFVKNVRAGNVVSAMDQVGATYNGIDKSSGKFKGFLLDMSKDYQQILSDDSATGKCTVRGETASCLAKDFLRQKSGEIPRGAFIVLKENGKWVIVGYEIPQS